MSYVIGDWVSVVLGKCPYSGCENAAKDPHTCPYRVELSNGTDTEECNCCDDCEYQCARDI